MVVCGCVWCGVVRVLSISLSLYISRARALSLPLTPPPAPPPRPPPILTPPRERLFHLIDTDKDGLISATALGEALLKNAVVRAKIQEWVQQCPKVAGEGFRSTQHPRRRPAHSTHLVPGIHAALPTLLISTTTTSIVGSYE